MANKIIYLTSALTLAVGIAMADVPKVAVDIAPVHSLVSKVMNGLGKPRLVIPASASPHQYQLRPSEAKSLQDAKLVFWIGKDLTPWLDKGLAVLAKNASVTTLLEVEEIKLLDFRENIFFQNHDDHDDHDDHEGHDHGEHDPHAWLSPEIAKIWLNIIATKLSEVDPDNAETYFSNANSAKRELDLLSDEVNKLLDPVRDKQFIVF